MYESTRSNDELRLCVTQLLIKKHRELRDLPDTLAVIMDHEANAYNIGVSLLNGVELEGMRIAIRQVNGKDRCSVCQGHLEDICGKATYSVKENGLIVARCGCDAS